jgi:hypothetical protein
MALFAVQASADQRISDPSEIEKIIKQIPITDKDFGYKSLFDRLPNLGIKVIDIRTATIKKGEAEPPYYLVGDQVFYIYTNEPNEVVKAICPIMGNPEYVKRGKKYIAQNRTAYWLMTNRCDFKG